jgi:uncharacterized protein
MKRKTQAVGSAKNDASAAAQPSPVRGGAGHVTLSVHVQPGARLTEWAGVRRDGLHGDALRLRVAARAVDGQANAACTAFVAECAGVPRGHVSLVRGARSRAKLFRIEGISSARIQLLLEACGL